MSQIFPFSQFLTRFPTDETCLEELKRIKFPDGIKCTSCKKITKHYKVEGRTSYVCKICRTQTYPLAGTIFEKSTTPLRFWFYALYLMTQTKAQITTKQLQKELRVTYKTAWRMRSAIYTLMLQNKGDLLKGDIEYDETFNKSKEQLAEESKIFRWSFFNKIEFKVVQRKESS